jgi:hypothetical protein
MKKIIKLNETDLVRIVKRVLNEKENPSAPEMPETPPAEYIDLVSSNNTEKSSNLYDDEISKVKKCFEDVKKLGPIRTTIGFPTSCSKDLKSTCIEDLKIQISKFMGATQKNGSLMGCLKKVGKLKVPLSKWEESIS